MRDFTDNAQAKVDDKRGVEPLILLQVDWGVSGSGITKYYADKDITIDSVVYEGKILDFSPLNNTITSNFSGDILNAQITLDDTDETIKGILNEYTIESSSVTVIQYFEGLEDDDFIILMRGKIMGEMRWSEGERTFTFEIQTYVKDNEVGYRADEEDRAYYGWDRSVEGKFWPMIFGSPEKTPTIQLYGKQVTSLAEDWKNLHSGSGASIDTNVFLDDFGNLPDGNFFLIVHPKDARTWGVFARAPMKFYGSVNKSNGLFTCQDYSGDNGYNLPVYSDIDLDSRPTDVNDGIYNNKRIIWIDSEYIDLRGQLVLLSTPGESYQLNRCVLQEGNMCTFEKEFKEKYGPNEFEASIVEVAPVPREEWGAYGDDLDPAHEAPFCDHYHIENAIDDIGGSFKLVTVDFYHDTWYFESGCECIALPDDNIKYICDYIGGGTLDRVYYEKELSGTKFLSRLDNYSDIITFTSKGTVGPVDDVSYLEIDNGLLISEIDEKATGRIFVNIQHDEAEIAFDDYPDLTHVLDFNNIADVIRYLTYGFSDVGLDYTSWRNVFDQTEDYETNFCLVNPPSLLPLLKDLAWQSRCSLTIKNGLFNLQYLSMEPTDSYTLTDETIKFKSLDLTFKNSLDIKTNLELQWFENYYDGERVFVYKNNEDIYGLVKQEALCYIYNNEDFVQKTGGFWGYRYSNSWRNITLKSFLNALRLEAYDPTALQLDILSLNTIRGIVNGIEYNSLDKETNISIELASRAGDPDSDNQPQEDSGYWFGDPRYAIPSVDPDEDTPPKCSYVTLVIIEPSDVEGSYYYNNALSHVGTELWNNHMEDYIKEYRRLVDAHTNEYASEINIISPGNKFEPYSGYYQWTGDYHLSKVVAKHSAHVPSGDVARYDNLRLFTINENYTLQDLQKLSKYCGVEKGTTDTVYLYKSDSLTAFVNWLKNTMNVNTVNEYGASSTYVDDVANIYNGL